MKKSIRTSQGGSVLGFVIVGVVLVGLLAGGVYLVRHNMTSDQPVDQPVTVQPTPADTPEKETPKPTPAEIPAAEPTPAPQPAASSTTALPQTGPADTFLSAIAIMGLVAAAISYLRSRRFDLRSY